MSRKLISLRRMVQNMEDLGEDPDYVYIDPEDTVELEDTDDTDTDED